MPLYAFFWVISRRLNFICRRFGTLSLPSSYAGRCEEWTRFEKCWGIIRERVWLENSLSQTFSRIIPQHFSNLVHSSHLPAYDDGTDSVPKRRHIKFRRQGITQKKAYNIQNNAKVWNQECVNDICDQCSEIKLFLCVDLFTFFLQIQKKISNIFFSSLTYKSNVLNEFT
jgi:hypothetical protein